MEVPAAPEIIAIAIAIDGVEDEVNLPQQDISSPLQRVTPTTIVGRPDLWRGFYEMISRIIEEEEFRRSLNRSPPSEAELIIDVDGEEAYPSAELSPEIGMINAFYNSGDRRHPPAGLPVSPEGGDGDDGGPGLPPPVDRFMRFRIYGSIPAISGTCIHVIAELMEPTTENKLLIGISLASLVANVATSSWLIFRGGNLANDELKNICFKSMFVFTGTLTLYASFSTLSAHLFNLPGIVLCGVLAVGLGHSDGLKRLGKKVIATVKNATQRIREFIA